MVIIIDGNLRHKSIIFYYKRFVSTPDSNLGLQITSSVHYSLGHSGEVTTQVKCIYVLYKMHFRVTTSENFYGALLFAATQPTTSDHINIKYIWGPHGNHMGTPR